MLVTAVIGANFGDEGKGLMTDYFASQSNKSLVVRYNGGAQAGHTVTTPSGVRHIFSHFGSGAFAGAQTFLSRFFVTNPFLWEKEFKTLTNIFAGCLPRLLVDPGSLVTTPYDMLVNQAVENFRGLGRYGSCGVGFNETIERNKVIPLHTGIINRPELFKEYLCLIRDTYSEFRYKQLTGQEPNKEFLERLNSNSILESFLQCCENFAKNITFENQTSISSRGNFHDFDNIVFEGAQGLLLDQDHRYFPHVTHSKTGLKNILTMINEGFCNVKYLNTVYVTRSYMTRHGNGPLPGEDRMMNHLRPFDKTNVSNEYQGSLRFARLNPVLMRETIQNDISTSSKHKVVINPILAVTCLDQYKIDYKKLSKDIGIFVNYLSSGPSRNNISCIFPTKLVIGANYAY